MSDGNTARQSPWRIAAYRRLWSGTVAMALANRCERLAVGWFVLMTTDSVFLTAAAFAVQKAPTSLVAPLAGDISDRRARSRILVATAGCRTVVVLAMAALASADHAHLWAVFALVALSGILQTFEIPATQGLITDTVPPPMAMKAVAWQSTGARGVGALGSLTGGLVVAAFGIPRALVFGAAVFAAGAVIMASVPPRRPAYTGAGPRGLRAPLEAAAALLALGRLPLVRTLLLTALVVEIFAFAYQAVLPSVARDLLALDADGLGTLDLMAGVGGVLGVAVLAAQRTVARKGALLIVVTVAYGLVLLVFASSRVYLLSCLLMMGVGAMAAVFDALQWTLLQQHVPDERRGLVIGGWMFVISFGWIGQLAMGALGQVIGVNWALGGAGCVVVLTGVAVLLCSARLRSASDHFVPQRGN